MLEHVNLSQYVDKKEYQLQINKLKIRMGEIQRKAWKMEIPIIVVFEGWHVSGMTDIINRFLLPLNPMGFEFNTTGKPCEQEEQKPLLWRFWMKIPKRGEIAIFDRSWYRRAIIEHFSKEHTDVDKCLLSIRNFERQLVDDGYLVIKFFLHISKETQQRRYEERKKKEIPLFITEEKGEEKYLDEYDNYFELIERILQKTNTMQAPWTIIESDDLNFATIKVMESFIEAVEHKIDFCNNQSLLIVENNSNGSKSTLSLPILKNVDTSKFLSYYDYRRKKKYYIKKLVKLQYEAFKQKKPIVIVFEGWDASGKGGSIRRIAQKLNPRLYRVVPTGVPNDYDKAHHYLWRFCKDIPEAGHIAIFDRSWYGRVLVEKVEHFCTEQEWKRAYQEINEFEETLVNYGMIVMKFWLHIDKDEQLDRFQQREQIEHKKWKITPDDWNNREKWELYEEAVDEMLQNNSTIHAPWTIVEANDKYYARIRVLQTVVETLEKELA
jgi:polyphosphate:AMP phosphotransferase